MLSGLIKSLDGHVVLASNVISECALYGDRLGLRKKKSVNYEFHTIKFIKLGEYSRRVKTAKL